MKMKNIITLMIFIAVFTNVNAQSFVKENKIWSVAYYQETEPLPKTEYYKFEGDTTIDSKIYIKTLISNSLDGNFRAYNPLIREENNVIYVTSYTEHNEQVLYDFNLKEGDLFFTFFEPANPFIVDSVVVRNIMGVDRKNWYLSLGVVWIEGIGSLCSPVQPFGKFLAGGGYDLICVHDEGTQIYQSPLFTNCESTSSSPSLSEKNNLIEIYPTIGGQLKLSLLNSNKGELTLYSAEGRLLHKSFISDSETEICAPAEGLLLFRFVNEKGEVQSGKVFIY